MVYFALTLVLRSTLMWTLMSHLMQLVPTLFHRLNSNSLRRNWINWWLQVFLNLALDPNGFQAPLSFPRKTARLDGSLTSTLSTAPSAVKSTPFLESKTLCRNNAPTSMLPRSTYPCASIPMNWMTNPRTSVPSPLPLVFIVTDVYLKDQPRSRCGSRVD